MMRLGDIPVRVEAADPAVPRPVAGGGLGGGVVALLAELAARLERLAQDGGTAVIDLRSLPLSPAERLELLDTLGQGEVTATLEAQGASTVRETAFAGIWWIEHRDRHGEITAELLDVTLAPEILAADPLDVGAASTALRQRIGAAHSATPAAKDSQ